VGHAAASWVFDGNTTRETYAAFLSGYNDGDPKIMDHYQPRSWLSGEWAGERMNEILGEPETDRDRERQDAVADAYSEAADTAYWRELARVARIQTT
jgi:hypothetical protein